MQVNMDPWILEIILDFTTAELLKVEKEIIYQIKQVVIENHLQVRMNWKIFKYKRSQFI